MKKALKKPGKKILVIPDSHATPHFNNTRFDILGKFILDTKPDIIVNIGDMADMSSLCSYDKGKKSFEGRRYKKDVEAVIDAQTRLFAPLKAHNEQHKKNKKKQYKPSLYLTIGNHEQRINRAVESQPELEGTISIEDLKYEEFGWTVIPFLEPLVIESIAFSHYFIGGVMGRAISGEHPAYSLITKQLQSCIQGHSHLRDFCERTTADGRRIMGLTVGCYLDTDQKEAYAGEANKMWWKGVVILNDVHNGQFEPEFVSIKQLRERYET
jgi:hypothetical protein